MQGRCVYRGDIRGTTVPHVSHKLIEWTDWLDSEGIDSRDLAFTQSIEVTEFEDGSLVLYCTRYQLADTDDNPGGKFAHDRDEAYRLRVRTFVSHHPVRSIQMLLDALDPEPEAVPV